MRGVLASYLRRRVALHICALAGILAALMQVLELLDVTTDVLDRGLGLAGVLRYAALRLPSEIVLALPLAALLGAMSAFHEMTRHHEMIPIRSAGVSLTRVLAYLLPVPVIVGVAQFTLSQTLVPVTEAALKDWWEATAPPGETPDPRWVRTSAGPVSYATAASDGRQLTGLRVYVRGADRLLSSRISARKAEWDGGAWQLEDVEELRLAGGSPVRVTEGSRTWKTNLRPEDVLRLDIQQPHLSSSTLFDIIAGEGVASQPLSYYRTALYRSFTAPVAACIMLLLAMAAARGARGSGAGGLLVALGLGLTFMVCDGLMTALGTSGRVPALAAALLAPIAFGALGLLQLRASERA